MSAIIIRRVERDRMSASIPGFRQTVPCLNRVPAEKLEKEAIIPARIRTVTKKDIGSFVIPPVIQRMKGLLLVVESVHQCRHKKKSLGFKWPIQLTTQKKITMTQNL